MRKGSLLILFPLGLDPFTTVGAQAGNVKRRSSSPTEGSNEKRGFGFLEKAFRHVKQIGEIIDPDTVSEVEKAWKELKPEINKVANEYSRVADEVTDLKNDAEQVWTEVRRAVAHGEGNLQTEGNEQGLKFQDLAKDAGKLAKELLGEVIGDVTSEIASTFETAVSEALSEENLREASLIWQRLLDIPGVQLFIRDRSLWAGAEKVIQEHLQSFMSPESAMRAERAMNATADFVLHFAGLARNAAKSDSEVFQELSARMCHLQGAAERVWPLMSLALPLLGYQEYRPYIEQALRAHALSRITLAISASTLTGLNPREDPFLMTIVAAFSLGHLTKDVAVNLALFMHKAMSETAATATAAGGGRGVADRGQGSALDLVNELMAGSSTCDELGRQVFEFFKVVKRAVSEPADTEMDPHTVHVEVAVPGVPLALGAPGSSSSVKETSNSMRTPHKLGVDGVAFQFALCAAAVADDARFFVIGSFIIFCLIVACWLWVGRCLWGLYRGGKVRRSVKVGLANKRKSL